MIELQTPAQGAGNHCLLVACCKLLPANCYSLLISLSPTCLVLSCLCRRVKCETTSANVQSLRSVSVSCTIRCARRMARSTRCMRNSSRVMSNWTSGEYCGYKAACCLLLAACCLLLAPYRLPLAPAPGSTQAIHAPPQLDWLQGSMLSDSVGGCSSSSFAGSWSVN